MVKRTIPIVPLDGDPDLERALFLALRAEGYFFATTEEEVAREEERQAREPLGVAEPASSVVWLGSQPRQRHAPAIVSLTDDRVTEDLARAARNGKAIPPEVEERMHADRIAAEGQEKK